MNGLQLASLVPVVRIPATRQRGVLLPSRSWTLHNPAESHGRSCLSQMNSVEIHSIC